LTKEDFQVFEDGVEQTIAGFGTSEEPISVLLALDASKSMAIKLARVQVESTRFVNLLKPTDEAAILAFSDRADLLAGFTRDRRISADAIKGISAQGGTSLFEAVQLALGDILKPIRTKTALVLFSDGVNDGIGGAPEQLRKQSLAMAMDACVAIYCIYFNTQQDTNAISFTTQQQIRDSRRKASRHQAARKYLSELSIRTGGKVFDALKMDDLGSAFESIAKDLACQYYISYYSANTRNDGKFREIQVSVKNPSFVVRTRKGYYAVKGKG
jgi:VWFA-related protein